MITLLGSLLGFTTSFLPEVLGYFKANQAHKHELERAQLEMDLMSKRAELKLSIMDKEADIKETEGYTDMIALMREALSTHYAEVCVLLSLIVFLLFSLPLK